MGKRAIGLNWNNGRVSIDEVAIRVSDSVEGLSGAAGSEKKFGGSRKSSEEKFGEKATGLQGNVGRTAQKIIDFVVSDPAISAETMAGRIGITSRAVEKQIAKLRSMGILVREGSDKSGYWRIVVK